MNCCAVLFSFFGESNETLKQLVINSLEGEDVVYEKPILEKRRLSEVLHRHNPKSIFIDLGFSFTSWFDKHNAVMELRQLVSFLFEDPASLILARQLPHILKASPSINLPVIVLVSDQRFSAVGVNLISCKYLGLYHWLLTKDTQRTIKDIRFYHQS